MAGGKRRTRSSGARKSKPGKPGKAPAPSPARLSAAQAFGQARPPRTPAHVSRSGSPPKPPKPPRPRPARPPAPLRGPFLDSAGRWRNPDGTFLSRETLFAGFFPGSFEDTGQYLQELGERLLAASKAPHGVPLPQGADRRRRYMVAGRFLGLPEDRDWRMLSNAYGLGEAVYQAGGRLRFSKKFNRYALAVEDHAGPLVVYELGLHELPEGATVPRTAKQARAREAKKKPARKKRRK